MSKHRATCCIITRNECKIFSNEEQLIKLCTDAGFVKTVAFGQYFMTKDAEDFFEFDGHVACREYTLF